MSATAIMQERPRAPPGHRIPRVIVWPRNVPAPTITVDGADRRRLDVDRRLMPGFDVFEVHRVSTDDRGPFARPRQLIAEREVVT